MRALLSDMHLAARSLGRTRVTAVALLATLGLGVGANATVFSFVEALLLTPLPFADPDRLVRVESIRGGVRGQVSALEVADFNERARLFEGFAPYRGTQWNLADGGVPEEAPGAITTYNLFALLGARPILGETWPASHDRAPVFAIVLSHGLWTRRFGADPTIVGRPITLDSAPYTVLGVMGKGFGFPGRSDLWRRSPRQDYDSRAIRASWVVARLKPGVTIPQGQAEVDAIAAGLEREFPETNRGVRFRVAPLREAWIGDAGSYLAFLSGAVAFVLAIACANAAGILLARALERRPEVAVRIALGASRSHLVRLAVAEGLVLAIPTAALGLAASLGGIRLFEGLLAAELPPWMDVRLDLRVFVFALGIAIVACLLASLLTVGQAWRLDVQSALRGASPRLAGGSHARLARSLVALQFGLSLTLLAGAGVMVRNVLRVLETRLGFDPSDVVTIRIDPPWFKYSKLDQSVPFFRRVLEEIATLPGVEAAAANDALPLTDQDTQAGPAQLDVLVEGQSPAEAQENPVTAAQIVSHGYFDTLRIPLVAGRGFEDGDRVGSPDVALVSQRTAERFWPGRSALGRRLKLGLRGANYRPAAGDDREEPWVSVIGVVGNVRRDVLSPPAYDVYLSDRQRFVPETYLAVRGRGDPFALAAAVRTAVMRVDPEQSIFDIRTMDTRLKDRVWHQRLSGTALAVLAAVALGLAAIGLYGLVARSVAARRREIAVRASLGAGPADIVRLVIGDVVPLLALGAGGGLLAVLALRPVVVRLMHGPVATDWLVLPVMAMTLAAVALIAAFVPARRAARGNPALALRD